MVVYLLSTVALAGAAAIGYLWQYRLRPKGKVHVHGAGRGFKRAEAVAASLEEIIGSIHKNLAAYESAITKFKKHVKGLSLQENDAAWSDLLMEIEGILKPTLQLAAQTSCAADELRQESHHLMAFSKAPPTP